MFSRALKNLYFFHSTFISGLLLCYIAIFKGDIFFPPWQLANTDLIGERNSTLKMLDLSGLCSQHWTYCTMGFIRFFFLNVKIFNSISTAKGDTTFHICAGNGVSRIIYLDLVLISISIKGAKSIYFNLGPTRNRSWNFYN